MGGYQQYPIPNMMTLNPHHGMYPYVINPYTGMPYGRFGRNVNPNPFTQSTQNPFSPTKLLFLATLEFPNLAKSTNDPIQHHFAWPSIPTKIPTEIPKFDGKTGDDPTNHMTTYHLCCVSNSFLDDSLKMQLFPHTLTRNAAKWFIELLAASFYDFQSLEISFLTHF